jgi:DNA-binding CsgD family transcriptional regulator
VRVAVTSAPGERDGLRELTPSSARSSGWLATARPTARFGGRLFLSPLTVSSHLYRSYPKLGVAATASYAM